MGMGGISVWQLLIVLLIVLLLFGGKKLRSLGGDLGSAIKGFRSSVRDGEAEVTAEKTTEEQSKAQLHDEQDGSRVINSEATTSSKSEHKL
ncbi:MAG: twin-arginine translocase TatA/TatE family subunit [Pseudomonadota bacterium]|nr:twin-arginine translocase TatA/TatE family subunit [Pseudomonadota bacterium]